MGDQEEEVEKVWMKEEGQIEIDNHSARFMRGMGNKMGKVQMESKEPKIFLLNNLHLVSL